MDEETEATIQGLREEVRILAMFATQAIALIAFQNLALRQGIDDLIAHYDGMASTPDSKLMMSLVRDAADRMTAEGRRLSATDGPRPPA